MERMPEFSGGVGRAERRFFIEGASGAKRMASRPRDSAEAWSASRASLTGTRRTWIVMGLVRSRSVMTLSPDCWVKERRTVARGFFSKSRVMVPHQLDIQSPSHSRARSPTKEKRNLDRFIGNLSQSTS